MGNVALEKPVHGVVRVDGVHAKVEEDSSYVVSGNDESLRVANFCGLNIGVEMVSSLIGGRKGGDAADGRIQQVGQDSRVLKS